MSKMFFQPDQAWVGDLIPYYEDSIYYAFYLHDPRCKKDEFAEDTTWHLVTTRDFETVNYHGIAIERGSDEQPHRNAYTGSVIKDKEGTYHVFFTGYNADVPIKGSVRQVVMKASGKDLYHLTVDQNWIFTSDEVIYETFDWRDPYVFYDEKEDCYRMLLAARKLGCGALRGGCLAHCTSKDLVNWKYEQPFYEPQRYVTMECPELFKWGDWYYLGFSTFNDRFVTHYRKSRSVYGPWEIPVDDVYDTRLNYAIKSAGNDKERYAFGWIASRKGNCDDGPWEWGGTMDFLKLTQDEKTGDLHVIPTEANAAWFDKEISMGEASSYYVQTEENSAELTLTPANTEMGALLYDVPAEAFEYDVTLKAPGISEFGIALHTDENLEKGYFLRFFQRSNLVAWDRWPRTNTPGSYQWQINGDIPYIVETERYLPGAEEYRIRVMKEGSICAVYINEQIVLSFRMYDHQGGKLGVYVTQNPVTILAQSLKI